MWICAPLPLDGTSHGKLLIWLNLGCKGTHGGRLWNCNLSELHFSSLISLLAFLERLFFLFFTKRPILSLLVAREDPQKESFSLEKNFFGERQFLHYPLHWLRFLCGNTCWKVYFISGSKFPTRQNGLTVYCAVVPRPLIHSRPLWDFELVLRRQKHRQEGVSTFQPLNVTALVEIFGLHCVLFG